METLYDKHDEKPGAPGLHGGLQSWRPNYSRRPDIRPEHRSVEQSCPVCGKQFFAEPNRLRKGWDRHCSLECGRIGRKAGFVTPESTKAERLRANGLVNMRLRRGWFTRPKACQVCGTDARRLDMHHRDYSKPEEVHFLCRGCHIRVHRNAALLDGVPHTDTSIRQDVTIGGVA